MSKEEPLAVSNDQLIRLLKDANKKLGDHARLLTEQLAESQKRVVMLREFVKLLRYYIPASAVGNMTAQQALAATADPSPPEKKGDWHLGFTGSES